ncbi:MAG: hypothetical protein MUQ00_13365 [Candidatus Aminicenantes bacterium]|nr:hypothetical protein [Candidatus Aminicenantes bacterium]
MKLLTALGQPEKMKAEKLPEDFSTAGLSIIDVIEDEALFGPLFKKQETWAHWKIFLRGLFGLGMEPEEQRFFTECTGRAVVPSQQSSEAFCIAGRRSGKSFISAVIASYLAIFRPWRELLSRGEMGYIFVVAADRQQARVILSYIKSIFALPAFEHLVAAELKTELRLKNNISVEVRTASFRTIRGYTVLAAILDELAFFRDENSANPAQEILTALLPALSTVPGSLLLGISTPYAKSGVLYEAFRAFYGKDEADVPFVWKAPTTVMNPCFRESAIRRFFERDKVAARSEYSAEFREDLETYMSVELIESLTLAGRPLIPPVDIRQYSAFVDVSGGRQDSFTLAIVHRECDGMIIVNRLEEVRSPIPNPQDVIKTFCEILHTYRVTQVVGDKYGGNWSSSEFNKNGVVYVDSKIDKNEIYLQFQALCAMHQIRFPDSERLRLQLQALERRTRAGGKDTVDHPEGLHDDVANACAGVAVHAFQQTVVTEKEMEAMLPHLGHHKLEKYMSPSLVEARRAAERQKSCEKEMDDFMMGHEGTRRIIKR